LNGDRHGSLPRSLKDIHDTSTSSIEDCARALFLAFLGLQLSIEIIFKDGADWKNHAGHNVLVKKVSLYSMDFPL
jgi:hypothetical protein